MKKQVCTIFLLLFFSFSFSQIKNLDSLKNAKEIYIFFEKNKNEKKEYEINFNEENVGIIYSFYFNKDKYPSLIFSHIFFQKPIILIKNKSFLKENKNKLVDYNFLKKHKLTDLVKIFNGDIYLIDKKEFYEDKIIIRKVRVQTTIPFEM